MISLICEVYEGKPVNRQWFLRYREQIGGYQRGWAGEKKEIGEGE